jgi:uncharacterized protein DUF3300
MLQTLRAELAGTRGAILVAALCALLAAPAGTVLAAQEAPAPQSAAATEESVMLSNDQLDALVAPIALYPDPLLAQCLVASTYPLDIVAAQQWLPKNASLKGDALVEAAQKESWDPSVQALVSIPDALKVLSENIKWTTELGDAFLAQQSDVMDAVQRLRAKAKDSGKLASSEQQNVETKTEDSKTIIEIQPASTEVVYVPTYSPSVIWGVGFYPYPPLYYPPYYGGAWLGFGVGIAIGIGISGGWGWGCGWHGGGNTININNNNNYVSHNNARNNTHRSGNSNWQHNAQQRGGAPYKDRATASKYGGGARGDSPQARQSQAQSRQSQGGFDRGGASAGSMDRGGSGGEYRGGSSSSRAGSRDVPSSSRGSSAFGGSMSGSSARSTSSRGSSSMGGMRGGGGGRGGGRR